MHHFHSTNRRSSSSGQSLIETALLIPLLLLLVFNAINFGYYFLVAIHLSSAPREGAQYSIMGYQTPAQLDLPRPGGLTNTKTDISGVAYLALQDMTALVGTRTTATVRICSEILGTNGTGSTQTAKCQTFGTGTFTAPASDPEAPLFVLHRVDVQYTIAPLIAAEPFGLQILPSYTFHRQVSMRALN